MPAQGRCGDFRQAATRPGSGWTTIAAAAPTTFSTKREASLWLAETVTDRHRGLWIDPRQARTTTVAEWAELWWPSMADLKPRPSSATGPRSTIMVLPTFGSTFLDDLKPSAVRT